MSMPRPNKVTCPKCGKEIGFTLWESINTEMDFAIPDIISGKLFEVTCDGCGFTTHIVYPMLFNDMIHHVMIYFSPNLEGLDTGEMGFFKDIGYKTRFVAEQADLREKTAIFNAGLDDRVVEIAKVFLRAQLEAEMEDKNIGQIYLNISDDGYEWEVVVDGKPGFLEAPDELFDELTEKVLPSLPSAKEEPFVIDSAWAMDFVMNSQDFSEDEE